MFYNINKKDIELLPHKSPRQRDEDESKEKGKIVYSHPLKIVRDKNESGLKGGGIWQRFLNFFKGSSKDGTLDLRSKIKKTSRPLDKLYRKTIESREEKKDSALQPVTEKENEVISTKSDKREAGEDKGDQQKTSTLDLLSKMNRPFIDEKEKIEGKGQIQDDTKTKKQVGFQYDINLIREEFVPVINVKKMLATLLLASLLAILVIVFIYFVVDFIKLSRAKKVKELQAELKRQEQLLVERQDDLAKIQSYYDTYKKIKFLLDKHLYWTNLLDFIENNTISTVYYESIRASRSGLIDLAAKAKDYGSVWRQYEIFKNSPVVAKIEIKGATLDSKLEEEAMQEFLAASATSSATSTEIITYAKKQELLREILGRMPVQFNITLVVKPELFYKDSKGEKVVVKSSDK